MLLNNYPLWSYYDPMLLSFELWWIQPLIPCLWRLNLHISDEIPKSSCEVEIRVLFLKNLTKILLLRFHIFSLMKFQKNPYHGYSHTNPMDIPMIFHVPHEWPHAPRGQCQRHPSLLFPRPTHWDRLGFHVLKHGYIQRFKVNIGDSTLETDGNIGDFMIKMWFNQKTYEDLWNNGNRKGI